MLVAPAVLVFDIDVSSPTSSARTFSTPLQDSCLDYSIKISLQTEAKGTQVYQNSSIMHRESRSMHGRI